MILTKKKAKLDVCLNSFWGSSDLFFKKEKEKAVYPEIVKIMPEGAFSDLIVATIELVLFL